MPLGASSFRRALALSALLGLGAGACRSAARQDVPVVSSASLTGSAPIAPGAPSAPNADVAATRLGTDPGHAGRGTPLAAVPGHELAAFAEGCFWGSENTFRHVEGVTATAVGYSGGHTQAPTYESVCSHGTGHAEVVLVEFDPKKVAYAQLLETFWKSHDPTTKNRQGPDVGDQYRSAIFTFSPEQAAAARQSMAQAQKGLKRSITTEITPMVTFWVAEDHHQQYDEKSGRESCPLPGGQTL